MEIGLDADRFWGLTPKQAGSEIRAAVALQKLRHDEMAWLAWNMAALQRIEKFPSLKEFLGHKPRKRSWQEISAELSAWAASTTNDNRGR